MPWSGHSLDYRVARAMPELGWPWGVLRAEVTLDGRMEYVLDGALHQTELTAHERARQLGTDWRPVPMARPSQDLGDSFRVLDALAHRGDVQQARLTWRRDRGWRLCFEGAKNGCVESQDLATAICLGALLVAGGDA